jgi:hypothetical protein
MYSIVAGFADFYGLGNQPLTESQVDQLPTDPHKLWPLLEGFDGDSLNSDTANPHSNASTLYTDSLGRIGTVLHIGIWTMAIDTATGQILSMTQNAIPGVPICGGKVPAHSVCQPGGSSTSVYVSAQLAATVPKAVAAMIANSRAHEPQVSMAPAPAPKL